MDTSLGEVTVKLVFISLLKSLFWKDSKFFFFFSSPSWIWICPALANSVDPDQLSSEEANWSGSTLFASKYVNLYQHPGLNDLIDWKLELDMASIFNMARINLGSGETCKKPSSNSDVPDLHE